MMLAQDESRFGQGKTSCSGRSGSGSVEPLVAKGLDTSSVMDGDERIPRAAADDLAVAIDDQEVEVIRHATTVQCFG